MIQTNFPLKKYHSFSIDVKAASFASFRSIRQFNTLFAKATPPVLILGGGSNVLFSKDFKGTVLRNEIRKKIVKRVDEDTVLVRVGGGNNWHNFVMWAVKNNLGGIENLALIPGTVGAAPIQNIGAYGVELKDSFEQANAWVLEPLIFEGKRYQPGQRLTISKQQAQFGYRDSIFKRELKGKVLISDVTFKLTQRHHRLNLSYKALADYIQTAGIKKPTLRDIAQAVIAIRRSKLPNPKKIGNSGSFFKNPVVPKRVAESIKKRYPALPLYPVDKTTVKIPAGWLIQQAGWKGFRQGDAGCYPKQALVLVNYGNATGQEVLRLARRIQESVKKQFGIEIQPEVNIL